MYKPKYLTREFVVYRDPKLDPRSEMQAGGVVQREMHATDPFVGRQTPILDWKNSKSAKELVDAFTKAYQEDDISYLFSKSPGNSKGKFKSPGTANLYAQIVNSPGAISELHNALKNVDKNIMIDDVLDMFDEREAFYNLDIQEQKVLKGGGTQAKEARIKLITDGEDWLMKNAKNYSNTKELKKGFKRVFKNTNHPFLSSGRVQIPDGKTTFQKIFFEDFATKGTGANIGGKYIELNSNNLDEIFKASLYNFNPQIKNKVLNDIKEIVQKEDKIIGRERYGLQKSFKNNKLFKELGLTSRISGPIVRLLSNELRTDVGGKLQYIKTSRGTTVDFLKYMKDIVPKKYQKEFDLTVKAINAAGKGDLKGAKDSLKIAENINYDHSVPLNVIQAGYADPIEYIKLNPVGENFNAVVKNKEFDSKISRLIKEYEATPKKDRGKIIDKMNELKDTFNKRHNNYLGNVTIKEVDGKLNFSSGATKTFQTKTDIIKALQNNFKQNPQLFQVAEASFGEGCRVKKSAGGRIPGEDYNACIARNFNETVGDVTSTDDAKRAKATTKLMQMGRGAAKLGKGALKGLQAVLIGTGAGEIAATAVLEAAAPIYNYFEGEELERVFASAPILGFALSKIDPENFSDEALEKIVYGQGLTDEEIIDAEIVANQLRRYKKMTDLFRQRASLLEYEDQLISEGAQPGIVDDKIAEIDKQVAAEAAQFAKEGNEVTKERIMSFDKGIQNYAEETQFQKEKRFVNKYLTNPAADPMTPRDYIDRKKASLIGEFFGDLSPVDGPLYQIGQNLTPELRTIATPEVKDYYNFAEGGIVERKGFANGPKITRRGFLGAVAAIVASLKLGSFGQTGKKVTTEVGKKVIKNAPKGTPDWFAPLVDKVFKEGVDAGDTMKTVTTREVAKKLEVKNPETNTTETYFLYENPDTGEIRIDIDAPFLGANDGEFSLYMRPDRVDGVTDDGRPILEEGEFFVTEERAVGRSNGPDDFDIELETIDTDLSGSASDYHRVEEFATGKTDKKAQAEQLKKKDYIEKNPGDDIESRYGPYDDTPPDDYYD